MRNNIKDGDKPWDAVSSIEWKYDGIKLDNHDWNTEVFPVGTSDSYLIGSIDSNMIGVTDSYKFWV